MCDAQTQEGSRPREPAPRASLRRKPSTASNYPLLRLLVIRPCDDDGRPLVRKFSTILYPVGLIWLLQSLRARAFNSARVSVFGPPHARSYQEVAVSRHPTGFRRGMIIAGWGVAMAGFPQRQPRLRSS